MLSNEAIASAGHGVTVEVFKGKSHRKKEGNESVDLLAKQAATDRGAFC